ncbi:MAG: pilus assembly protein PilM, partial [Deferribacterales bacterium]
VILAVARKDIISGVLSTLAPTKMKVSVVDLEVFALINAFELTYGINADVNAILNLGHSSSMIVFIKNGYYEFSREMGIGGKDCIEMVQKKLGISYEDARTMVTDKEAVEFNEDLQRIISDFNTQLSYEIKHSIELFFTTTRYNTSKIYLCGGLAILYDVKNSIERTTDIPVEEFNPFLNINTTNITDFDLLLSNPYLFNTALGLALRKVKDR